VQTQIKLPCADAARAVGAAAHIKPAARPKSGAGMAQHFSGYRVTVQTDAPAVNWHFLPVADRLGVELWEPIADAHGQVLVWLGSVTERLIVRAGEIWAQKTV